MRSELHCDHVRPEISALLDGELSVERHREFEHHLAGCDSCAAYAQRIAQVRQIVRLQPVEPVPDLTERINEALAPQSRGPSIRPYLRTAALAGAAALLVFLGTSFDVFDRDRDVAAATEIVHSVQAAARELASYRASFDVIERGWHPDIGTRRFTARVWFASPERFRLEVQDRTDYPGDTWSRNDVTLVASPSRWSIVEPATCPTAALPACSVGATTDTRTIVDRQPFDGNSALPTDIAVPLETLSSAAALDVVGSTATSHHVKLIYQQAAPLVLALQQGGSWRPFHPLDRVDVWIDRETWFPTRFRVSASDSMDRELWAERVGLDPESPGSVLLEVRATGFEEPRRLPGGLFRPRVAGAVSSGDFTPARTAAAVPEPTYLADLSPYRQGVVGRRAIATYTDGMTWLRISSLEATPAPAYTSGAEVVDLGEGAGFYFPADGRSGRSVEIFGRQSVRVESNLPREDVLRVGASLGLRGIVPRAVRGAGGSVTTRLAPSRIPSSDRPDYLPPGFRMVAAVQTLEGRETTLTLHFRRPQTSFEGAGIRVVRSGAYETLAPSSEDFVHVRVGGNLGRWSFERSELEWMDGLLYRAVAVPGADLATALNVAESLR